MDDTKAAVLAQPLPLDDDPARFQSSRVITISLGHAIHDTYTAFLAPLLPVFIENLALTKTEAGLLSVFMQGPSVLQPLIGHLADRANLRYLVVLAPAISAVAMSLLGSAPSYAVMALLLLITGFSSASLHAVAPVLAGNLSGRKLGRGMSFWMVGGEMGRTLGPVLVVTAVGVLTLQRTYWLMIGGLVGSALLYARLRDVPGKPSHAVKSLPWRQALQVMSPLLLPLTGIVFVRSFLMVSLTTYLPILLREGGANLWLAGASLTVLEAAGVAGALLGGSLSDRLGRRVVLWASMLATPVLMFAFLGVQGWLQFLLLLLLGFSALSVTPVIMAVVQESYPENRALANGVYMALSFVLRSVVVLWVGMLGDRFGQRAAFAISAAVPLLGLPLLFWLPIQRRQAD